jgi:hypothetical protein
MGQEQVYRRREKGAQLDITKANKIFDYLLEKGQIKLIGNHRIFSAQELKKKRYCINKRSLKFLLLAKEAWNA